MHVFYIEQNNNLLCWGIKQDTLYDWWSWLLVHLLTLWPRSLLGLWHHWQERETQVLRIPLTVFTKWIYIQTTGCWTFMWWSSLFSKVPIDEGLEVIFMHLPLQWRHTGRAHHNIHVWYMAPHKVVHEVQDEFFEQVKGALCSLLLLPTYTWIVSKCSEDLPTDLQGMDRLYWRYFRAEVPQQRGPGQIPATS